MLDGSPRKEAGSSADMLELRLLAAPSTHFLLTWKTPVLYLETQSQDFIWKSPLPPDVPSD